MAQIKLRWLSLSCKGASIGCDRPIRPGQFQTKWKEAVRRWGGTPRVLVRTDESISSSRPLAAPLGTGQPDSRIEPNVLGVGLEPEGSLGVTRPLGSTIRLVDLFPNGKETAKAPLGYDTGGHNCPKVVHPREAHGKA